MACLHASEPVAIGRLVRALLGTSIEWAPMLRDRAHLVRIREQWHIYLRQGTPAARMRFYIGHELAHWWYRKTGRDNGEDLEERCDRLGASLAAPRPFCLAVQSSVPDLKGRAEALGTTQSLAVLRQGETVGTPIVLLCPSRVLVRGDAWGWPDEQELRRLARRGHPAIRRVEITDESRRIALLAA